MDKIMAEIVIEMLKYWYAMEHINDARDEYGDGQDF